MVGGSGGPRQFRGGSGQQTQEQGVRGAKGLARKGSGGGAVGQSRVFEQPPCQSRPEAAWSLGTLWRGQGQARRAWFGVINDFHEGPEDGTSCGRRANDLGRLAPSRSRGLGAAPQCGGAAWASSLDPPPRFSHNSGYLAPKKVIGG